MLPVSHTASPRRTVARQPRPRRGSAQGLAAFVAALVIAPAALAGQVNIEALTRDDPPFGRSGSVGGNMTIRTGNVDLVQIGLNARYYVVEERMRTLMIANGGIGFLGRSRFASSGLFHYRRTYTVHEWVSPEWFGQANYDRAQLLSFRTVGGAGVRTAVADGTWGEFSAGTSLMLEHERLDLPPDAIHPSETTAIRSSTFASLRLLPGEHVVITSTTYVQPRFSQPGDVRVLESFRLASPISDDLQLTVTFDFRYDADPPDGIARLDTTLRTGVTYTY